MFKVPEEFSRNIGVLTEADQSKISQARVAVAGVGGVGGLHVLTLARLGVGKFTIADPDIFEQVNINRQFGALSSTFGANKAEVLARMVSDIHPNAQVQVFREGVNPENIGNFLKDADVALDGIDFFEVEHRRLLHKKAREKGVYCIGSGPIGFGSTLLSFAPTGMSIDEYFGFTDSMTYREKIVAFAVGVAPQPYHLKYMNISKVSLENKTGPAVSFACTLATSLVVAEVTKLLTGKGSVISAPHYVQFDLFNHKFKKGCVWLGGKNPIQVLKRKILLRMLASREKSKGEAEPNPS